MGRIKVKDYLGKSVKIVIDRQLGSKHPKHDFIYMVNYGYVLNTISGDGEKLIVVPDGINYSDDAIRALTEFQERYFISEIVR